MRLTAWEEERLLVFTAAELARRHRDAGLLLAAPEAVALICDAMFEAARAGADYAAVEAAGRTAVAPAEVLPGVAGIVGDIRLEVLMADGVRLVVLVEPLGPAGDDAPGAVVAGDLGGASSATHATHAPHAPRIELTVENTSRRVVRISSHYPFDRVNRRLVFDRSVAAGHHLDIPAGSSERWGPGEVRTVRLRPFTGSGDG